LGSDCLIRHTSRYKAEKDLVFARGVKMYFCPFQN
jgi:hypothetical protein